jgi:hypothetical protein
VRIGLRLLCPLSHGAYSLHLTRMMSRVTAAFTEQVAVFALVVLATGCDPAPARGSEAGSHASGAISQSAAPVIPPLTSEERAFYRSMARQSWSYLDANYQARTGLVNATPDWANTTVWDVGSQLLAYYSAQQLGLIDDKEYDKRIRTTFETLAKVKLFRNAAYNKLYSTADGSLGNSRLGWSATDLGRLLVALKIIATQQPQYAQLAEQLVRRNDFKQIVKNGYLQGQLIGSNGKPWTYQEGRIGYEQYVARGFAAWGADVRNALTYKPNAKQVNVFGVALPGDKRSQDRLLSEPFVLYGIELGFNDEMRDLAANVLRAQEARFKSTGVVTMVSEDALSVPPHYFYYYCVYCNAKSFVIDVSSPGSELNSPRWVSTKAAFGWHALMPSDYTQKAIGYVAAAKDAKRGWASGVFEKSGLSTKSFDINTASVLLEIALYQLRGRVPLIEAAPVPAS